MHILKHIDLTEVRERENVHDLNAVIILPKGEIQKHLPTTGLSSGRHKLAFPSNQFVGIEFTRQLYINKHVDKLKLDIRSGYVKQNSVDDKVHRRFYEDGGVELFEVVVRLKVIQALSYLYLMKGGELHLYNGSQHKDNLVGIIGYHDIQSSYKSKIKHDIRWHRFISGGFNREFNQVFNYLWHNLKDDISGKDNEIKRISMEEGLTIQ